MLPMDLLAVVKERLSQQYPEMADVELSAVETDDRVTIFTFHKELRAEDGALFPKTVRVTVENDTGAILDVAVSRTALRPSRSDW